MKKTLSLSDFRNEIAQYSDSYKNQFSYYGIEALYNYLEEINESTGEDMEFDFIALCCDFTEYENEVECAGEYGWIGDSAESQEENEEQARKWLEDRTQVIEFDGNNKFMENDSGIIIQNF